MNTKNLGTERKYRRIDGWVLVIVGGAFVLLGGYLSAININFFVEYASTMWDQDFFFSTVITWSPIVLLLDIGLSLLILSARRMTNKNRLRRNQIWGWILLIFGWPFIAYSCIIIMSQIYDLVFDPVNKITFSELGSYVNWPLLELVCGLPLVILGIWFLLHKEKTSFTDPYI